VTECRGGSEFELFCAATRAMSIAFPALAMLVDLIHPFKLSSILNSTTGG
jgi:hypothetical protein